MRLAQAVHDCETRTASGRPVRHVVLPPRWPSSTPLADLRDAGYDVVGVQPLPSRVPDCPDTAHYSGCIHVLLRRE